MDGVSEPALVVDPDVFDAVVKNGNDDHSSDNDEEQLELHDSAEFLVEPEHCGGLLDIVIEFDNHGEVQNGEENGDDDLVNVAPAEGYHDKTINGNQKNLEEDNNT